MHLLIAPSSTLTSSQRESLSNQPYLSFQFWIISRRLFNDRGYSQLAERVCFC
jgi:hypothetical protein